MIGRIIFWQREIVNSWILEPSGLDIIWRYRLFHCSINFIYKQCYCSLKKIKTLIWYDWQSYKLRNLINTMCLCGRKMKWDVKTQREDGSELGIYKTQKSDTACWRQWLHPEHCKGRFCHKKMPKRAQRGAFFFIFVNILVLAPWFQDFSFEIIN